MAQIWKKHSEYPDNKAKRSKTKRTGLFLFLLPLAAVPPAASGRDINHEIWELQYKIAEVREKQERLNILNQQYGRYKLIRDTFAYGERGIFMLSEQKQNLLDTWLRHWVKIFQLLETDPTGSELRGELRTLRWNSEKRVTELQELGEDIGRRCDLGITRLEEMDDIPDAGPEGMAEYLRHFGRDVEDLKREFQILRDSVRSQIKLVKQANTLYVTATDNLARRAMLQYPKLQQAVEIGRTQAESDLRTEALVRKIKKMSLSTRQMFYANRIFRANDLHKQFMEEVEKTKEEIRKNADDPAFIQGALREIDMYAEGVEGTAHNRNQIPKHMLVARNFSQQGNFLAQRCRDPEKRKYYNCELFREVFSIPVDKLETLSEMDLKMIENYIEKIKAGPLQSEEVSQCEY